MSFTQAFLDTVIDPQDKAVAEYFNSLPIKGEINFKGDPNSDKLNRKIRELAAQQKIAQILKFQHYSDKSDTQEIKNKSYTEVLNSLYYCNIKDLENIIAHLESLQSGHLKKLISALKDYRNIEAKSFKANQHPKGLYQCLTITKKLNSLNISIPTSLGLQQALLKGVVIPVFSLFDDLESHGDLTLASIPKLKLTKVKLLEALTQFNANFKPALEEELQNAVARQSQVLERDIKPHLHKISLLEHHLSEIEKQYQTESENLLPRDKEQIEEDIKFIINEISQINLEVEELKNSYKISNKRSNTKLIKARMEEKAKLNTFLMEMNDEVDYMIHSVYALAQKANINAKYPINSNKSELKARKKEIKKLQETTGLHYLLSDDGANEKKFIQSYGGKLLFNQNQAKLAAMAHSDGLCGGYSAEFLEICSATDWEKLSFREKLRRFKPILVNKDSIKLNASAVLNRNDLWMTFESGVRWDIQLEVYNGTDIFKINKGDTSHAVFKKEKDNTRAFFQMFVDKIMEHVNKHDSSRLLLDFFSKDEGHVVGLNYDKDGFLFHDSNTGYIRFEDKAKFAVFLVEYLIKDYPDLNSYGHIYDFDQVRKNVKANDKLKLKSEKSRMRVKPKEEVSPRIKKQESSLLIRMDTLKSKLESTTKTLSNAKSKTLELTVLPESTPEVSLEKSKSKKTLSFSTPKPISLQEHMLRSIEVKKAINNLLLQYLNDYDDILDQKPVFKQRIFNELQIELIANKTAPNLEKLKKLCIQHKLLKCSVMLDNVAAIFDSPLNLRASNRKPK